MLRHVAPAWVLELKVIPDTQNNALDERFRSDDQYFHLGNNMIIYAHRGFCVWGVDVAKIVKNIEVLELLCHTKLNCN